MDTAVMMLRFANGAIGTIDNSRQGRLRLRPAGGGLWAAKGRSAPPTTTRTRALISDAQSVRRDLPLNFFMERYAESYLREMQAFVQAVLRDEPVPVTGHDGRVPVVMALAAQKSHRENRPVRLSEIENEN